MYEARDGEGVLSANKRISVKVSTVTKRHAWKTPTPASVAWINNQREGASATQYRTDGKVNCIRALIYCCQVRAVAAQDELRDPYVRVCIYLLAALGFIALMWKAWQFTMWLCEPPEEPEDDFEPDGPRQVTLQMRLLDPRDGVVLRLRRGNSPRRAEPMLQLEAEPPAEAESPAEAEPQPAAEQRESEPEDSSPEPSIDEEYEQLWEQRAAEALAQGMAPEQIVRWRRREERAAYTGQYQESSDEGADFEEGEEEEKTSSERTVPPDAGSAAEERVAPPAAGSAASVRADPPGPEPESEDAVQRIPGQDPFAHMTPEEVEQKTGFWACSYVSPNRVGFTQPSPP